MLCGHEALADKIQGPAQTQASLTCLMCWLPCRGGRHKRLYRFIDLKRAISQDVSEMATVQRIEYDPNRSARIALLQHTRQGWS